MSVGIGKLSTFVLYFIGFLLIWEWMRPFVYVTDIHNLHVFVYFLAAVFFLHFLKVKWPLKLLILGGYIVAAINGLYFGQPLLTQLIPTHVFSDIGLNLGYIVNGNWLLLTDSFRTFLLFILLWSLVNIVHYWVVIRKRFFFLFLLTIIYLADLDTFFSYDASWAIVRTMVSGFFALSFLNIYRFLENKKIHIHGDMKKHWFLPATGMIVFSTFIGMMIPENRTRLGRPGSLYPFICASSCRKLFVLRRQ